MGYTHRLHSTYLSRAGNRQDHQHNNKYRVLPTLFLFCIMGFLLTYLSPLSAHKKPSSTKRNDSFDKRALMLSEKPITVVVLTYKNPDRCLDNINSILRQKYKNFRVIIINDNPEPTDRTHHILTRFIKKHPLKHKITYIKNKERKHIMANHVHAISLCTDKCTILVHCDGDDRLLNNMVLKRINYEYSTTDCWVTSGSYINRSTKKRGRSSAAIPLSVLQENKIRKYPFRTSHLRSFYKWLFDEITSKYPSYLTYKDGNYVQCAADLTFMSCLIELAGPNHFTHITDLLYEYNDNNPKNVYKSALDMSQKVSEHIRSKEPLKPLAQAPLSCLYSTP